MEPRTPPGMTTPLAKLRYTPKRATSPEVDAGLAFVSSKFRPRFCTIPRLTMSPKRKWLKRSRVVALKPGPPAAPSPLT